MKKMFFLLFSVCFAASAWADTVILKSGKSYETPKAWKENGAVKIEKFGGVLSFPEAEVSEIILSEKEPPPAPQPVPEWQKWQQESEYETLGICKAGYDALETGMWFRDVKKILGSFGEEMSQNQIGETTTMLRRWQTGNPPGVIDVIFQNYRVVQKSQAGLK